MPRKNSYVLLSAVIVSSLLIPGGSRAAEVRVVPGEWSRFLFPRLGQPALDVYSYNASPTGSKLLITDAGASGDIFSISVNGLPVGTTSTASRGYSCGFDAETCFSSSQMSQGIFPIINPGEQSVEITSTQNAFTGIGGAGFIKVETSFANLYGNVGVRTEFVKLLNSASKGVKFYEDKFDLTTKFTQLFAVITDKKTINSFGSILSSITSGVYSDTVSPDKPIDLLLVEGVGPVWGGAACVDATAKPNLANPGDCGGNYNYQAIDMADIRKLNPEPNSDTPSSIVAHEVAEAFWLSVGNGFSDAHDLAISAQNNVLLEEVQSQRAKTIGSRKLPKGIDTSKLYLDPLFNDPLLQGGLLLDYSSLGNLWYSDKSTEGRILFPWVDSDGKKGWSIWVMKFSAAGWTFADLIGGVINTGVPWSGRSLDIDLESITFVEPSLDDLSPNTPAVPGPLPLLGVGAAFGYSRKLRKRIKSSKLPVASAID